jgi:hypothetical protein
VTDKEIEKSGLTSIGDLLQRMPVSGGAINSKFNTSGNIGFPPDGSGVGASATTADLRHLGSKRVLVLVDGLRWVNESSASGVSSATDLNTIPTSIIDRIEVLQDEASSSAVRSIASMDRPTMYPGCSFAAAWLRISASRNSRLMTVARPVPPLGGPAFFAANQCALTTTGGGRCAPGINDS